MAYDVLVNAVSAIVTAGGTTAPGAGSIESWTVTASSWPVVSSGTATQFRVIDQVDIGKTSGYEIMIVALSANGSGVTWGVIRGAEGTTPYAHAANWVAVPTASAGGLDGRYARIGTGQSSVIAQTIYNTSNTYGVPTTLGPLDTTNLTTGAFEVPANGQFFVEVDIYVSLPAVADADVYLAMLNHSGGATVGPEYQVQHTQAGTGTLLLEGRVHFTALISATAGSTLNLDLGAFTSDSGTVSSIFTGGSAGPAIITISDPSVAGSVLTITSPDDSLTMGGTAANPTAELTPLTGPVTSVGSATALVPQYTTEGQDTTGVGGAIGSASVLTGYLNNGVSYGIQDLVIGDSISHGDGGVIGTTDWASVIATVENRKNGLVDAGRGFAQCASLDSLTGTGGTDQWSSLAVGAAAASGVLGGPGGYQTAWKLTATGQVVGDNRYTFRRVKIYYYLQTSGATVTFATTGKVVSSGSLATAGTNGQIAVWDSGDIGTVGGTGFTCTAGTVAGSGATSAGVVIIGCRYYQNAGTNGLVMDNLGLGGSTAANWAGNVSTNLVPWLTFQAANSTPYRRVYIIVGINDALNSPSAYATYQTNLTTIVSAIQTASPNSEIVLVAEHFGDVAGSTLSVTTTTATATATVASGGFPSAGVGATVTGLGIPTGVTVASIVGNTLTMTGNTAGITGHAGITLFFAQQRGGAANWAANWVSAARAVAIAQGCTFIDWYALIGDISATALIPSVTTTTTPSGGGFAASVASSGFGGAAVGNSVWGTGIQPGTTVLSISGNNIVLSLLPFSTGTVTLGFSNDRYGISAASGGVFGLHLGDAAFSVWGSNGQQLVAEHMTRKIASSAESASSYMITTGTVGDGKIVFSLPFNSATFGVAISGYNNTTDANPSWVLRSGGLVPPQFAVGAGGASAPDTGMSRNATSAGWTTGTNNFTTAALGINAVASSTAGTRATAPPSTATIQTALGNLALGTNLHNTLSYDVRLTVFLSISANTSGVVKLGVGSATGPTQTTIITGVTTTGIVPITFTIPAGYFALLSISGTVTDSLAGQYFEAA